MATHDKHAPRLSIHTLHPALQTLLACAAGLDPNHLICMPGRSAIPSAKNKWFTGRAGAFPVWCLGFWSVRVRVVAAAAPAFVQACNFRAIQL